jgi:hypothetical protein
MAEMSRVPLIYIAGSSHSGSTLLDLVLGSHSRIESLGEAKKIPEVLQAVKTGKLPAPLCSCRTTIAECPFWKTVFQWNNSGPLKSEIVPFDSTGEIEMARRALTFRHRSVLVDSSKILGRLNFLAKNKDIAMHCLHLTRDPRAVAFSAARKSQTQGLKESSNKWVALLMRQSKDWASLNKKIRRSHKNNPQVSYLHLRYEDFVHDPENTLISILEMVNLELEPAQMQFRKFTHHNIEGNRLRLQNNSEIHFDSSYLQKLSAFEWMMCSLLLMPSLGQFGYPFNRRVPAGPGTQKTSSLE